MEIRLFGPMEVRVGGDPLPRVRTRKTLWLLALLVIRAGRDLDRSWLSETLWPDSESPDALRSLRQTLHDLRCALGSEACRVTPAGPSALRIDLTGGFADVPAFDNAIARGDVESLAAAVKLYRGPLLEDCSEEWVLEARRQREHDYLAALERLASDATVRAEHEAAASYLRRAIDVDPCREEFQRALMEALAAGGSPAGALLVYRQLRSLLWREMAADPAEETTALFRRLRDETRARAGSHAEPKGKAQGPKTERRPLPTPLTALIGREEAVREVSAHLGSARLVTLTGTGGIGKTRLALRVAEEVSAEYPDGVGFVDLAPLADPERVPDAVRTALGIPAGGAREEPIETLKQHLSTRRLLIVLDNCEHLLDACATLAETLLAHCSGVRILATSRQPLGFRGEWVWQVPSLAFPMEGPWHHAGPQFLDSPSVHRQLATLNQYPAVRLFLERVRAAGVPIETTPRNALAIVEVVRRLDGIPLAIELAAARTRSLSIEEIRTRLNSGFALMSAPSALAPRHKTLEAAFKWSWDLLSPAEQLVLGRLSVFAGSWSLEDAETVCSGDGVEREEIAEIIASLVDQSLVCYSPAGTMFAGGSAAYSEGRYWLLETVRQFARERLQATGKVKMWRDRHLATFMALGQEAEPHLNTAEQQEWFETLDSRYDNIREALRWACSDEGDTNGGLRLAAAIWRFWDVRGHWREGRRWLSSILAASSADRNSQARATALYASGGLAFRCSDYAQSRALYEECLAIRRPIGDREGIARCLLGIGNTTSLQGDYADARRLYEESLTISRELDDRRGIAMALFNLGNNAIDQGNYPAAGALLQEALEIRRELHDQRGIATALNALAMLNRAQGDHVTAEALGTECLSLQRELGNRIGVAMSLGNLGSDAISLGKPAVAQDFLVESLAIRWELGDKIGISGTLEALAAARNATGRHLAAASLGGLLSDCARNSERRSRPKI